MKITSILVLSLFITFLSCNGQEKDKSKIVKQSKKNKMNSLKEAPYNVSDEGDGTKASYDELRSDFIEKAINILKQRNFQFPDQQKFNDKIEEVFGFKLNAYKNMIFALRPSMFPEVAIRKENFVFIQDANSNPPDFLNSDLLFHLNSYIIYNSNVSYSWLLMNERDLLFNLVIHYGYNKDKRLVETVFQKFDFNSLSNMEELIFRDQDSKKALKKAIFNDIEDIIYKGPVDDFSYAKEGNAYVRIGEIIAKIENNESHYIQADNMIAYLYERELRVGISGDIQEKLNRNKAYKSFLEKNNYFGYKKLEDYVTVIYQSPNETTFENSNFTVVDPDGYTNLRKEKNTSSEILQKVKSGENVVILNLIEDWYLVKTKEGKEGYIHKSRIKSE